MPNVFHAFKWQEGAVTNLGAFPPENQNCSNAVSVNAAGEAVGLSEIGEIDPMFGVKKLQGVLWTDGRMVDLGTLGEVSQYQQLSIIVLRLSEEPRIRYLTPSALAHKREHFSGSTETCGIWEPWVGPIPLLSL